MAFSTNDSDVKLTCSNLSGHSLTVLCLCSVRQVVDVGLSRGLSNEVHIRPYYGYMAAEYAFEYEYGGTHTRMNLSIGDGTCDVFEARDNTHCKRIMWVFRTEAPTLADERPAETKDGSQNRSQLAGSFDR